MCWIDKIIYISFDGEITAWRYFKKQSEKANS